jgi:hypothetical protein
MMLRWGLAQTALLSAGLGLCPEALPGPVFSEKGLAMARGSLESDTSSTPFDWSVLLYGLLLAAGTALAIAASREISSRIRKRRDPIEQTTSLEPETRTDPQPAEEWFRELEKLQQRLKVVEDNRERVPVKVPLSPPPPREAPRPPEFRELAALAEALRLNSREHSFAASPGDPALEDRLLAVVNLWLKDGINADRDDLLPLSRKVGLEARFYAHGDSSRIMRDPTTKVYPFVPSDRDGGWFWVELPDGDSLAVPADIACFRIGKAPDLLDKLLDGMRNPRQGFRFGRFYRACKFRQTEHGYSLLTRGRVLLNDSSPPGDWRLPPSFEEVQSRMAPAVHGRFTMGQSPKEAAAIVEFLLGLDARTRRLRDEPPPSPTLLPPVGRVRLVDEQTLQRLARLDERVNAIQSKAQCLEESLRGLAAPGAMASTDLIELRDLRDRVTRLEREPETRAPELSPELAQAPSAEASDEASAAPEDLPLSLEPPAPPVPPAPWDESKEWTSATQEAFANTDPGSPYPRRLAKLLDSLRLLPDGTDVHLVHLDWAAGGFRVHEDVDDEPLQCLTCGSSSQKQFAVSLGKRGEAKIQILFALGVHDSGGYPDGYRMLVPDARGGLFHIRSISVPARLEFNEETGKYGVVSPLQCELGV